MHTGDFVDISTPYSFLSTIDKARRVEAYPRMSSHRTMSANRAIAFPALPTLVQAHHGRCIAKSGYLVERAFRIGATCPTTFVWLMETVATDEPDYLYLMLRNLKTLACLIS